MKLYLVRHGDAASALVDSSRMLSEKGKRQTAQVATFFQALKIIVPQIYHSEKLRAQQTAAIIAEHQNSTPTMEALTGLMPEDPVRPIAEYCNHWQSDVMLVGHLPFMAKLAAELLCEREDKPCFNFETSAVLCLERLGMYQWCASWFLNPSILLSHEIHD